MASPTEPAADREIVLITGMAGSGKSVALNALEDASYYCVDNLPPELLLPFVSLESSRDQSHVAIAMDVRSAASLPAVPGSLRALRERGIAIKSLFLDASTETLVRRFSETRRRHPLSHHEQTDQGAGSEGQHLALVNAIGVERELLGALREQSHVIDTSVLRITQLQATVKSLISAPAAKLTLVFESFAFKRGIPIDADYVFDVRMLPNPFYEPDLRGLNGCDAPVAAFLAIKPETTQMQRDIQGFLDQWLPSLGQNHRAYVTVAIGCTGGQHRSVYLVEQLTAHFATRCVTLKRHREILPP
jgi:RNase adapter protein RapZ